MNWINLSDAENKLKENSFEDREALKYLIAFIILYTLIGFGVIKGNILGFISVVLQITITVWGILKVFKTNELGDGKDFFKRYIVISWIVSFRLLLIALFIIIPMTILFKVFEDNLMLGSFSIEDILNLIFGSIFSIIYYSFFVKSIARISFK